MISFQQACAIIAAQAAPLGFEDVPIEEASGRLLAAPVVAAVDSPPAAVSAMDGYAVRDCDLASHGEFCMIGAAYPGASYSGTVGAGEAVRVFTGARIPDGADRVIVQENVRQEGEIARIVMAPSLKRHIRPQGGDFRVGDILLETGHRLNARSMVAAAGADTATLRVWRQPRISIVATGDELVAPGEARTSRDGIPESVSYGVAALTEAWGGRVVGRHRLRDELAAMEEGARSALSDADLMVITGGASVGEKDFAKAACIAAGAEILFAKVAIQPGKPVWFARADSRLIIGLPGNPGSAMVAARLFLAPLIAGLSGRGSEVALRWRQFALAEPIGATGERESFVRGHIRDNQAVAVANHDSGMQRTLVEADILIRRPPLAMAVGAGSLVDVLDF